MWHLVTASLGLGLHGEYLQGFLDILVNETEPYEGTGVLNQDAFALEIEAVGPWGPWVIEVID